MDEGVLMLDGNKAHLTSMQGKPLKSMTCRLSALKDGTETTIGSYDFEVASQIPLEEYSTGRVFMESGACRAPAAAPPQQFKRHAPAPVPTAGAGSVPQAGDAGGGAGCAPANRSAGASTQRSEPVQRSIASFTADQLVLSVGGEPHPSGRQTVPIVVDRRLSNVLRPHQKDGVRFLWERAVGLCRDLKPQYRGSILADEMGLGKTLQVISVVWTMLKQGRISQRPDAQKAVIVTPSSLVANWGAEFKKWLGKLPASTPPQPAHSCIAHSCIPQGWRILAARSRW
jgi:DNA repair and recombination protein RAD54B